MFGIVSYAKPEMRNCLCLLSNTAIKGLATLKKFLSSLCFLENTKSTAYSAFKGPQKSCAQLQIGSSELVTTTTQKSWNLVSVGLDILNGEIATQIQLTTMVGNENCKLIHKKSLTFFSDVIINIQD